MSVSSMKQTPSQMPIIDALQVLVDLRRDNQIVVTQMGSAREWPKLSQHPMDFHYVPSTMGGGPSLALGLALADPRREVLAFSGDGSLLMNLGALITIAAAGVTNLTVVLLDNRVYEITGGQKTAAARTSVDFVKIAAAAGFPTTSHFNQIDRWRSEASGVLSLVGPRLIWLEVEPVRENYILEPPCPIEEQVRQLRTHLAK